MFFKNLVIYTFKDTIDLQASALKEQPFTPCGKSQLSSAGFVPPCPGSEELVHTVGQHQFICMQKEERILPAAVVNRAVNTKVLQIESDQGRQVFRKERDQIKDDVLLSLIPRAFTDVSRISAWVDHKAGYLVVNASSFRKAEEFTSLLRGTLGSLPVVPPVLDVSPTSLFTQWLQEPAMITPDITIGSGAVLKSLGEDAGKVTLRNEDLFSDEVTNHIATGHMVDQIVIHWNEALSATVHSDLRITSLKFTDALQEQSEALNADDEASRFDADAVLMANTLAEFIGVLVSALCADQKAGSGHEYSGIGAARYGIGYGYYRGRAGARVLRIQRSCAETCCSRVHLRHRIQGGYRTNLFNE